MKSIHLSSHKLERRLAAYAAAGVALAAPAMSSSARADIVYSGPLTLAVPQTSSGIYLDLVTGANSANSFASFDINPYFATNGLGFYTLSAGGVVGIAAGGATALTLGTTISSASTFITGLNGGAAFHGTGTEYLGLRFTNESTGGIDYGWVQLTTVAMLGFPATIIGYAYNNTTGGAIAAGQITNVPEPTTTAALGLGALSLGAAGIRRWRKARQAVA